MLHKSYFLGGSFFSFWPEAILKKATSKPFLKIIALIAL